MKSSSHIAPNTPLPLSPTEWQIMVAVWTLNEADAIQVSDFVSAQPGRALTSKTAGIFLGRLAQKGYLQFSTPGPAGRGRPAHLYKPAFTREDALRHVFADFLATYGLEPRDFGTLRAVLAQHAGPQEDA